MSTFRPGRVMLKHNLHDHAFSVSRWGSKIGALIAGFVGPKLPKTNHVARRNFELSGLKFSPQEQEEIIQNIVTDYKVLLSGEERKFFLGESSLFLINSREQSLITSQLKENEITVKRLSAVAKLFNVLGIVPDVVMN